MAAVIELFVVLLIVAVVFFALVTRKSWKSDIKVATALRAKREATQRLETPGEPLRCLGCGNTFCGPLTEDGCPFCQVSALVVAEKDYNTSTDAQKIVQRRGH